jgi:hypothetical protein
VTRDELQQQFPKAYQDYQELADQYGLWEEVLTTFEHYPTPPGGPTEEWVRQNLSDSCYEWDF